MLLGYAATDAAINTIIEQKRGIKRKSSDAGSVFMVVAEGDSELAGCLVDLGVQIIHHRSSAGESEWLEMLDALRGTLQSGSR